MAAQPKATELERMRESVEPLQSQVSEVHDDVESLLGATERAGADDRPPFAFVEEAG